MVIVAQVMSTNIFSISPEATILEAANKMKEARVSSLVVTAEGKPVGILTERDIIRKVTAKDLKPSGVRVKEAMSTPLVTVDPETELLQAVKQMMKSGIRRLPVMKGERLVGIMTTTDVVRSLLSAK